MLQKSIILKKYLSCELLDTGCVFSVEMQRRGVWLDDALYLLNEKI
jgi:hypothetical protein